MSYDKTNKGVLFKNDRKQSDKHPDYTGRINIQGVEHWLSAWINDGAKGKFMSLAIGDPCQQKAEQAAQGYSQPASGMDQDIPF